MGARSVKQTFPISFDSDRWVRVPVAFADEQWASGDEWAEWIADELTQGRESAAEFRDPLRDQAAAIAAFPTEHVGARFWFFPIDGDPAGWVDVYVQRRDHDGSDAAALLPDAGATLIEPAVDALAVASFDDAVRRLTLSPIAADDDAGPEARPGILAKGEWVAVSGDWAVYLVSVDDDPRRLTFRLDDIDALFAGIDPRGVAAASGVAR
ncbi:hypothetical protein [Agromyces sp. Leaf222]|uniref:hypothetical protein n=1 Tax=Agromyces sp. Leaf222 TaxID=1735688 RepID=UPI0006F84199|nr:hypothetical protein [Agromyces sp. Leaf222]KQM84312.1 hypothetical protein ASE68_14800 [Agromyces sp. Leaf222]